MSDNTTNIRCTKCNLYKESKAFQYGITYHRSLINNEGEEGSPIMFIGEAPGHNEVVSDKPFVGEAGNQLRDSLKKVGIKEFYISNCVRCRPKENKTPTEVQSSFCSNLYLYKDIERVKPKVLVLLGAVALKEVLGFSGITKLSGKVFKSEKVSVPCIPIVHPSYVIRNRGNSDVLTSFENGLQNVKSFVDSGCSMADTKQCKYVTVSTMDQIERLFKKLLTVDSFSFDIEGTGLDWLTDRITCISFSWKERTGVVIPFYHTNPNYMTDHKLEPFWEEHDMKRIIDGIREILQKRVWKYYNNGKFDNKMINVNFGIVPVGPFSDNMLAHHLLDETAKSHKLDSMVLEYTDMGAYFKVMEQYKKTSYACAPQDVLWKYSAQDADAEFRISKIFEPMIEKGGFHDLFHKIVMPYSEVVESMELNGICVDVIRIEELRKKYKAKIDKLEAGLLELPEVRDVVKLLEEKARVKLQERYDKLKRKYCSFSDYWNSFIKKKPIEFNNRSYQHVKCLLYDVCNVTYDMTGTQSLSTDESILEKIKGKIKPANRILELRKLNKFYGTYIKNIPELVTDVRADGTGRLHTTFKLHGTVTGRLASKKPNLQNQPKRDIEKSKEIRSYIIPEKGCVFLEADNKAAEFRCLAECSQDPDMIKDLNNGLDIHTHIAAYVLHKLESKVTDEERSAVKGTVFGIMYGRGAPSVADEYGISVEQANSILEYFKSKYPVAAEWVDKLKVKALKNGYVMNYFGRKRRFPVLYGIDYKTKVYRDKTTDRLVFSGLSELENKALRQGINSPIQSMAHDLLMIVGIRIFREFKKRNIPVKFLIDIHDAFLFEIPKKLVYEAANIITENMERRIKDMKVQMKVSLSLSDTTWADMKKTSLEKIKLAY